MPIEAYSLIIDEYIQRCDARWRFMICSKRCSPSAYSPAKRLRALTGDILKQA